MPNSASSQIGVQVVVAFLAQGRWIDNFSTLAFVLALLLAGLGQMQEMALWLLALSAGVGLIEKYFAFRVRLDLQLFQVLHSAPDKTADFEHALSAIVLTRKPDPARTMESRWRGAIRLLRFQIVSAVTQAVVLIAGTALIA